MKISVLTICFNSEKHIADCIQSIKSQTYKDFEHIVVDCGSTDKTKCIVWSHNYKNLKLYRIPKCEISYARNFAANQSNGEILAILDSDDIAFPNRLEKTNNIFKACQDLVLFGGSSEYFAEKKKIDRSSLTHKQIKTLLVAGTNPFAHSAVAIRKDAFLKVNGYSEKYKKCEDFNLFVKISETGKMIKTADVMSRIRMSKASHSLRFKRELLYYYVLMSVIKGVTKRNYRKKGLIFFFINIFKPYDFSVKSLILKTKTFIRYLYFFTNE